jgi:hypothetical protein
VGRLVENESLESLAVDCAVRFVVRVVAYVAAYAPVLCAREGAPMVGARLAESLVRLRGVVEDVGVDFVADFADEIGPGGVCGASDGVSLRLLGLLALLSSYMFCTG